MHEHCLIFSLRPIWAKPGTGINTDQGTKSGASIAREERVFPSKGMHLHSNTHYPWPAISFQEEKRRKEKLCWQRKPSLHHLRRRRNIGSKSRESRDSRRPPNTQLQQERTSGDMKGYWKHLAPESGCEK
eukprot:1160738-Pelagomonas_calceolata.AAC.4